MFLLVETVFNSIFVVSVCLYFIVFVKKCAVKPRENASEVRKIINHLPKFSNFKLTILNLNLA